MGEDWALDILSERFILAILQVTGALALLLSPSLGLAPSGPAQTAFKSVPDKFVAHPGHVLRVRSGFSALSVFKLPATITPAGSGS
ncbi:hypothetical protein C3432_00745 [Citrobacter amalonaticus]|uniref:Uncharacterized protein n=1 Tax=Citrobacter amalonaticus TaxID=35703 RepID=A0A2S4S1X2_CITAM|nr:hypothetical protein C3432_00745 [Citrobacter amalonaticus]POT77423.1 hypothetical protein C3436_08415 [Citrobacter amalonaticus]POU67875.1 hypothetical protein C3430_01950 [Citrobacter amalonaticus]POV07479.1 hypothetical protein C3424_01960 [Citrobacter amalonaticus]